MAFQRQVDSVNRIRMFRGTEDPLLLGESSRFLLEDVSPTSRSDASRNPEVQHSFFCLVMTFWGTTDKLFYFFFLSISRVYRILSTKWYPSCTSICCLDHYDDSLRVWEFLFYFSMSFSIDLQKIFVLQADSFCQSSSRSLVLSEFSSNSCGHGQSCSGKLNSDFLMTCSSVSCILYWSRIITFQLQKRILLWSKSFGLPSELLQYCRCILNIQVHGISCTNHSGPLHVHCSDLLDWNVQKLPRAWQETWMTMRVTETISIPCA